MDLLVTLVALFVLVTTYLFLTKGLPRSPDLNQESELLGMGYTVKEARREMRAQRAERPPRYGQCKVELAEIGSVSVSFSKKTH